MTQNQQQILMNELTIDQIIKWPQTITLKADNGKYLSRIYYTHTSQNNLEAIKDKIDEFCTFQVIELPDHCIALKGDNGKYLSRIARSDSRGGYIQYAEFEKDTMDQYCIFRYVNLGGNEIAFKGDTGLFLSRVTRNGRENIEVAKSKIDVYSKFTVEELSNELDKLPNEWDNYKVDNIEQALDSMSDKKGTKGILHTFEGNIGGLPIAPLTSHVQGVARYKNYLIMTHNSESDSADYGSIVILSEEKKKAVYRINTSDKGYNHPGGIQQIGNYLAVSLENNSKSLIRFYDLSQMSDTEKHPPVLLETKIIRDNNTAGAVGITTYRENGIDHFLLAVHAGGDVDFYKSNGKLLSDPECKFDLIFNTKITSADNVCLVTVDTEKIYLVGFRSTEKGSLPYEDYVDLYSININTNTVKFIESYHYITRHETSIAGLGVHFRYGAGIQVVSPRQINVLATRRNFSISEKSYMEINIFNNIWGPSTQYDTGTSNSITMDNNGRCIEVHVGEGGKNLYSKVGTVNFGNNLISWGPSTRYDTGSSNSITMDNNGHCIEVHVGEGGKNLYSKVGTMNFGNNLISWGPSTQYDTGSSNSITMDNNGHCIEVHVGEGGKNLYSKVGTMNFGNNLISWGPSTQYDTGKLNSISMDNNGHCIEVHVGEGGKNLYSKVGTVNFGNNLISWGPSTQYDTGSSNSITMDNNGRCIEVHVGEGGKNLYSKVGTVNFGSNLILWGPSIQYDTGTSNSIAMDNNGQCIEIHVGDDNKRLFYRVSNRIIC